METKASYVLVGAFTLLGFGLLLVVALWSAQYQTDAAWQEYEIRFKQAVTGLSVGSTVQFNGINMGSVRDLHLDPDDPSEVVARIRLESEAPVRADTSARLSVSALTGVALIQLRGGSPEEPPLTPGEDGSPPQIIADESPLQQLIDASEDIASTASEVLLRMLEFLSEENAERIGDTLDNIDAFTVALSSEKDLIASTLRNADRSSQRLVELLDNADSAIDDVSAVVSGVDRHLIERLPALSDDLSETLNQFESLSRRLDRVIAENEQSLSEFGVEGLGQFGPALAEFRQLIRELSRVSSRFERHPTRFLLGGDQPEEYQPQ
ncbi:MAG: MCE family protein [Gammaproteobacteria bacterium]|jgi:phospholipid/cholesterol/gamma-HCH transport system substrate-binding protein|nr:MCE family protein [Gammaproteobacteria bacterium]